MERWREKRCSRWEEGRHSWGAEIEREGLLCDSLCFTSCERIREGRERERGREKEREALMELEMEMEDREWW